MTLTDPVFSVVMPYHAAPVMLEIHGLETRMITVGQCDRIEFVICDDASPVPIAPPPKFSARLQLYRIEPPHVRWSHRCATNIAAHHARGEWLLITDMDHLVQARAWQQLFTAHHAGKLEHDRVYTFTRRNIDGTPYKPHPDSWLISRRMWNIIGGYDTRYRGHYGQNAAFMDRVRNHAGLTIELPIALTRYTREDIPDASMPVDFGRKSPDDRNAVATMRRQFHADGTYWKPGEVIEHSKVYP